MLVLEKAKKVRKKVSLAKPHWASFVLWLCTKVKLGELGQEFLNYSYCCFLVISLLIINNRILNSAYRK